MPAAKERRGPLWEQTLAAAVKGHDLLLQQMLVGAAAEERHVPL